MDIRDVILLIATLINLGFASTIVFRNPYSHINISYGLSVISAALWTLGIALFRLSGPEYAIPLARFYYISAALIATYFIFFGIHFPNKDDTKHPWWHYALLHMPAVIIAYLVFTINFISGFSVESWGKNITLGPAYIFYVVFWVVYMGVAFVIMLSRYKSAQAVEKLQLKFVLFGTLVAAIGGSLFNLFLPLFGNYQYIWAGPYSTLVMVVAIGYAIVKHRILDIRIITTEVFSATLLTIFLIQFFRSDTLGEFTLQGAILIASTFFFWLLLRAINREVRSREKIAVLATELASANEELKKLDAAKSEFISIAGHQLRTPLTVIKGYTSMVLEGSFGKIPDSIKESLNRVLISSTTLAKLVTDLLDLSRIESGKIRYEFKEIKLEDIIHGVLQELEETAKTKNIPLVYKNENVTDSRLMGDFDKLHEVVINIVDNAIKYSDHGSVEVVLRKSGAGESQRIALSVKDNGIGVKPEDIPKLFGKFVRSEDAKKIRPDGMGLGLYIAKRIVDDHGGRVWVESPGLGRGSIFTVELPALS